MILNNAQASKDDTAQLVALLCIGELGRRVNLEKADSLQKVLIGAFESSNEEVKSAASIALGNVAVGNLSKFLPFILNEVKQQPKRQYLLLHSLREIISRTSLVDGGKDLVPHLGVIVSPFSLSHFAMQMIAHCIIYYNADIFNVLQRSNYSYFFSRSCPC